MFCEGYEWLGQVWQRRVGAKDSGARRCEAVAMTSEVVRGFVEALYSHELLR